LDGYIVLVLNGYFDELLNCSVVRRFRALVAVHKYLSAIFNDHFFTIIFNSMPSIIKTTAEPKRAKKQFNNTTI
jgi:hypothetical protein